MTTPQLQSNRELYLAIESLSGQHAKCDRSLETYLLALLNCTTRLQERPGLSLAEFYQTLVAGFSSAPAAFEEAWREQYEYLPEEDTEFTGWRAEIVRQIVDLREMDECGTLRERYRSFGVESPRGARWYNFDPASYLECGAEGAFGGWEPGDDSGRMLVPGENVDAHQANRQEVEIAQLCWEDLTGFLICGRVYE